ncbi:efflux RND transporter periplasmic adaptor subunit [Candidatus Marimicrobium litorale]|uniref:Efflux RND transporter periplasmic adaptor subunit n=1 Tax=Candidatus Marimicrobium litorale TaxID=2518991 RepID=A0ABT3T2W4_9GAMM|nr:efflux RND transporter periplasmic adaptor subunit [Candidatus Marimicrobium litorale]MCX2976603.1 efflux RND transporter periplasmic adaptor subunit [Candidatus Marimicrobium litorale]
MMVMHKKLLYPIVLLVCGFLAAYLISISSPEVVPQPYEPIVPTVRVVTAQESTEYLGINSQGTVQPRSQSELIPEVSGRVTWISPSLVNGGSFKDGDVLLRIDDADYLTLLERSEASLQRADVEYTLANDELERLISLHGRQLASQQQLDTARRAARVNKANLRDATAALEQAHRDLSRTELKSPFDGLVRSEQVDLGQFVTRGQSIGTMYATDYVEVRLPISADQLGFLGLPISTRGLIPAELRPPVTIAADFGDTRLVWDGQLVRLEAEFDERSRMVYGVARLQLDEDEESPIVPVGLFVQAAIQGRNVEGVIRLPRSAMRDDNQIMVVDSDNRLRFRQISLLRLEHDDILVQEGLEDGELVCVSPLQTVVDGMRVSTVLE